MKLHTSVAATVFLYAFVLTGCGGGAASGGGPPGGAMPPMGVEVVTLAAKPVERTNEYVATVKSRRSTTIQPQVEGFVTRISVQPGQRVRAGAVLMQIDSRSQQATVASLESTRAARAADLPLRAAAGRAHEEALRGRRDQPAGVRAGGDHACRRRRRRSKAIDAQIREQRVELGYHNVTSLTAGVVGDIPVRVGDRVTRATVLTTVDENAATSSSTSTCRCSRRPVSSRALPCASSTTPARVGSIEDQFRRRRRWIRSRNRSWPRRRCKRGLALRPDQFVRARVVWAQPTRPDGAADRGDAHQRPVLRVRGGEG